MSETNAKVTKKKNRFHTVVIESDMHFTSTGT